MPVTAAPRCDWHAIKITAWSSPEPNGGKLENVAAMAIHASTRTTQLYDRRCEMSPKDLTYAACRTVGPNETDNQLTRATPARRAPHQLVKNRPRTMAMRSPLANSDQSRARRRSINKLSFVAVHRILERLTGAEFLSLRSRDL